MRSWFWVAVNMVITLVGLFFLGLWLIAVLTGVTE